MQAQPNNGPNPFPVGNGPRLDYSVQFISTGTHYLWIRALAFDGASDSLWVTLDGVTSGAQQMTGLVLDGSTWTWVNKKNPGQVVSFNIASPGVHTINVWMREAGIVLDKLVVTTDASYVPSSIGPPETVAPVYVAVGDSITRGSHDNVPTDGLGYEPILSGLLTASKGRPISVANVGVSGTTSGDGAASISTTLATYPTALHYLILYGSNDAFVPPVPSGRGLNPGDPGYSGSYKANMQQIISAVIAAGKTPYLAKVPFATIAGISDGAIQDYNVAITELVAANGIQIVPPDFYTYFKNHLNELDDGLHPNETGYQSMANMWFNVLQFID
jgi:lysophospholipase L1-like esterase